MNVASTTLDRRWHWHVNSDVFLNRKQPKDTKKDRKDTEKVTEKNRKDTEKDRKDTEKDRKDTEKDHKDTEKDTCTYLIPERILL